MNTSGIVTASSPVRRRRTISKMSLIFTPVDNARVLASWITGPSAVGSEKGIPISTMSAPAFTIIRI